MDDDFRESHAETLFAAFNAPARSGELIREALTAAGKSIGWFLNWIKDPAHLKALTVLITDALSKNWLQAVQDVTNLFSSSS